MRGKIILVTGASSGFGRLTSNALSQSGHTVYASMRDSAGRNAPQAEDVEAYARLHAVDLRPLELDVSSQASVDAAIVAILDAHGAIDVVVHNAGHMTFGPAEAFTVEQFAELYDVNVLSTQRVNRSVLPHMRSRKEGLVVWVSSSSVAGGTPPYLAPYFAAKAAMDALAVQYARELARWGIETSIVVPGAFTQGTNHFAHAASPADETRVNDYAKGPTAGLPETILREFGRLVPADADPGMVAGVIVDIVDTPFGERPFRVHVDPSDDGASVAFAVIDRVREEMLHRVGLADLLAPRFDQQGSRTPPAMESQQRTPS
jgi:NAD(P)-dependent dehydrogenase (short-subunit alcohol dehydrogenase family)